MKKSNIVALSTAAGLAVLVPGQAEAHGGRAFVGGLVGGLVGGAIANAVSAPRTVYVEQPRYVMQPQIRQTVVTQPVIQEQVLVEQPTVQEQVFVRQPVVQETIIVQPAVEQVIVTPQPQQYVAPSTIFVESAPVVGFPFVTPAFWSPGFRGHPGYFGGHGGFHRGHFGGHGGFHHIRSGCRGR